MPTPSLMYRAALACLSLLLAGPGARASAAPLPVTEGVVADAGLSYPIFPGVTAVERRDAPAPAEGGVRYVLPAGSQPEADALTQRLKEFYKGKSIGATRIDSKYARDVQPSAVVHISSNGDEATRQGATVVITTSAAAVTVELLPRAWPLQLPYASGAFSARWSSLEHYKVPAWFRDAKFGIWAHWGPQCEPEDGDWYARKMYIEGSPQYLDHLKRYGHPSQSGFKDIIHLWKAEHFDPDALVGMYRAAGARYFVAMAVHHDNFDLWNSKYQPWNAVNLGPHQDLVGKWAAAAQKAGLHFGVSIHATPAWSWYEVAQGSDEKGTYAGVPYDGNITAAAGRGQWWDGYDPQDLYEQHGHRPSPVAKDRELARSHPGDEPTLAYDRKFYNRVQDVVAKYHPDLVYFDDYKLPFYGTNQLFGLSLVAGMYNDNAAWHGGQNQAVVNTKSLVGTEQSCLVNDFEVGVPRAIQRYPFQVDACIGGWHYKKDLKYRSAPVVIRALVDVVSKNGNLLLNIPVRADGTIDDRERQVVREIGEWMNANGEALYGTRPWHVFGEGPSVFDNEPDIPKGGAALFRRKPYGPTDFRFTVKGGTLYAIGLAWPAGRTVLIKSVGRSATPGRSVKSVTLIGHDGALAFEQKDDGLAVTLPATSPNAIAYVLKITGVVGQPGETGKLPAEN